jgi:hypothetical protein
MSSPPDAGQPEFKFNHSVTDFVPCGVLLGSEESMETVQEVRDLTHDAPEFVPGGGFGGGYEEVQEPIPTFNLEAEEFTFTGKFEALGAVLPSAEAEFKPITEVKSGALEPVEDISTSDDEEFCAENRPLRPEDETDIESDYEEQPPSTLTIPHSPLRETSVRNHIYNPQFILTIRQDDLSQLIPAVVAQFMSRKIEEMIVESRSGDMKRSAGRYPPRPGPTRGPELPPVDPNWRPVPTEEEKKISEEAKKQRERITSDKTEDEAIRRTIKISLNKLSPANFDKLKEQLLEISKQNEGNLKLMSQGIFDKAWSQPKFTQLYAGLCQYLDDYFATIGNSEQTPANRPKSKTKKNVFPT